MSNHKEKTIKKISGEILLYLYWLQRKEYQKLQTNNFDFTTNDSEIGVILQNRDGCQSDLINKYIDIDLYNSLKYLQNKNLVLFVGNGENLGGELFHVIELTDLGIDIVEKTEMDNGSEYTQVFNFNFNLESLLKMNNSFDIESIIKVSAL